MKFTLKDYQEDAVDDILNTLERARTGWERDGDESSVALTAPTGAGKTVMAAAVIEALFYGSEKFGFDPDEGAVVLWFSDEILASKRATRVVVGGETRVIAAEDAGRIAGALGISVDPSLPAALRAAFVINRRVSTTIIGREARLADLFGQNFQNERQVACHAAGPEAGATRRGTDQRARQRVEPVSHRSAAGSTVGCPQQAIGHRGRG